MIVTLEKENEDVFCRERKWDRTIGHDSQSVRSRQDQPHNEREKRHRQSAIDLSSHGILSFISHVRASAIKGRRSVTKKRQSGLSISFFSDLDLNDVVTGATWKKKTDIDAPRTHTHTHTHNGHMFFTVNRAQESFDDWK